MAKRPYGSDPDADKEGEHLSQSNILTVRPDGPLQFEGDLTVQDADGNVLLQGNEAWLCRCGRSQDKPYCDGTHKQCGFTDPAVFEDARSEPLQSDSGHLTLIVKQNAMLLVKGPLTLVSQDGRSGSTRNRTALCRCGESKNKPFCDASHNACGFRG